MTEVLIIGGGVIGLSIARALRKKSVGEIKILERGRVGGEASNAAAGMLAPNAEAEKIDDFFVLCDESRRLYPDFAAELFAETGVDIELERSGTLYAAFSETDAQEIKQRYEWQTKAGLTVELLTAEDVRKLESFISPDVRTALFFAGDWQVENRKLLAALTRFAASNDIAIVENAAVETLIIENGRVVGARTATERFTADKVILATGAWTSLIKSDVFALPPIKPIRGQIIAFQTAKRLFQRVIYSSRGYLVPRLDGKILIGATVEDVGFDKQTTDGGTEFLRRIALDIAPSLVNLPIAEQWAGLRPAAADGQPILGAIPGIENLYAAAAHFRNGILLAPLTAQIIAEEIAGESASEYLEIFSPRRFQTAKN